MKKPNRTIVISTLVVPSEPRQQIEASAVVIIDVLRATTSIVVALSSGAASIYPVAYIAAARRLARQLPGRSLLAGERGGKRIPGFDLGNSPYEFQTQAIVNRTIVMCTTNGTKAIEKFASAQTHLYIAALVNLEAISQRVASYDTLCLVCSGKEAKFSLEDAFCAGGIVSYLRGYSNLRLDDGALVCEDLWNSYARNPLKLLQTSIHGEYLTGLGMGKDLEFCAHLNIFNTIPSWNGKAITLNKT